MLPRILPTMSTQSNVGRRAWYSVVLRDEHFWIPLLVLVAGLVVLRWIA